MNSAIIKIKNIKKRQNYRISFGKYLKNIHERKMLEKDLVEKILVKSQVNLKDPVLILAGKNWHEGIIGIVAAILKDRFNKPTIIISINGNVGKASARSIIGFDIGSAIIAATQENILLKGGGHKMAGGFSIEIKNINIFKDFIFKKFKNTNEDLKSEKPLLLDSIIAPSAVNLEFYNKVNLLSPFGSGNPEPKFIPYSKRKNNIYRGIQYGR